MDDANDRMRQTWRAGASSWVANEELFDHLFVPVTDSLLAGVGPVAGRSVLDVGCGSGTLLQTYASAGAKVTGVDISPDMVAAARGRVPQATVELRDAQTDDLTALPDAPFDVVVSRFGVMFFADPVAAFANLARAVSSEGRLVFACWQSRDVNPMFTLGTDVLTARLDDADRLPPDAPGPTSLADPGHLSDVLSRAGWAGVTIEPLDFVCDYGALHGTDGVEERLAIVLGTTTGRRARSVLEPRLGPDGWADLVEDVRAGLRTSDTPVTHPARTWIVTARL